MSGNQKRHTPDERLHRVEQLFAQGATNKIINQRTGISESTLKRRRKAWEAAKAEQKDQD